MSLELKLDSNKIFHKVFEGTKPGYNALQVDTFLDIVIKDYETMEKYVTEIDQVIDNLKQSNRLLKNRLDLVESQKAVMEEKLKNISDNVNASRSNIEYLQRISVLEKALLNAGIDPNTLN